MTLVTSSPKHYRQQPRVNSEGYVNCALHSTSANTDTCRRASCRIELVAVCHLGQSPINAPGNLWKRSWLLILLLLSAFPILRISIVLGAGRLEPKSLDKEAHGINLPGNPGCFMTDWGRSFVSAAPSRPRRRWFPACEPVLVLYVSQSE